MPLYLGTWTLWVIEKPYKATQAVWTLGAFRTEIFLGPVLVPYSAHRRPPFLLPSASSS